jgi:glycosyltransferase involved in cell wall biosynthesis
MKVLIAASACHPTAPSESYVGWQAVSELRKDHELWVLTSAWCREGVERFLSQNPDWKNVHFHFIGEYGEHHRHPLIARLESWLRYRRWCREAARHARVLAQTVDFDIAHHVTCATWRTGSPLAGCGVPWIWGPIGGGEYFPWNLWRMLSPAALGFEILRKWSTFLSRRSRAVKMAVDDASLILPNNPETESLMRSIGATSAKMMRLTQSFLSEERLGDLSCMEKPSPVHSGELRILAGGNLEGRKGVAIVLEALSMLRREQIPFHFHFLGKGPESAYLKRVAGRSGLGDRVRFLDFLKGEDFLAELKSAHVYMLPSLREGVPVTQVEAMAAGCVPLVAACGGAGPMAEVAGVRPIRVSNFRRMAEELASRAMELWRDPALWERQSRDSAGAISRLYTSGHYRKEVAGMYLRIRKHRKSVT